MDSPSSARANLYDYPEYYDLVYGTEWRAEVRFLMRCFRQHSPREVRRVFEPACGTGRLLFRLAREGLAVRGLDLNPKAVRFCNERFGRHGLRPAARVGDMTAFALDPPADAAFNMISSFRHLITEAAARNHLRCMARALRPGGLYVVGLHLSPSVGRPVSRETWTAGRGRLKVKTHMWTLEREPESRHERVGFSYLVETPRRRFRIADEIVFRTYTPEQFRRLIRGTFEIAGTYDFNYDIRHPVDPGPETQDVVFVLRKPGREPDVRRGATAKRRRGPS